jgi:hypothetical protein
MLGSAAQVSRERSLRRSSAKEGRFVSRREITIVTCFLAAFLAAASACGGGGSAKVASHETIPGGKTFRGGGLSFTYPIEWRVRTAGEPGGGADYQVKVGPRGRANDLIGVTVAPVGVVIGGKKLAITEENIDENKGVALMGVRMTVSIGGGKLAGEPSRVTVGGLPGFRAEASKVQVQGGARVGIHYTNLFKGTTTYSVSCVYTPNGEAEVTKACDQVLGSLRLSTSLSSASTATGSPLPLSERVIREGEFPGFVLQRPELFNSAEKWVRARRLTGAEAASWKASLRQGGFRAGLIEHLAPRTGSDRAALSWVIHFRSAVAARSEVGATVRQAAIESKKPGYSSKAFKVNGISGARGIHDTWPSSVGEDVVFSDGPFLYLIGNGWVPGATNPPSRSRLLAVAMSLYRRVRGHPAP